MVYKPVGLRAIAVSFPKIRRTNDYYSNHYPESLIQAEQKGLARVFSLSDSTPKNEFDRAMMPYLSDPFRGTVERWVMSPEESLLDLEYRAACEALDAAKLVPEEIELLIVAATWPEQIGFGDAAFLSSQLGLQGAAWNLDGACGSSIIALQTACALVRAAEYRNVLVVISCGYSRCFDESDTASWVNGDGASAFVVSSLDDTQGILGTKAIHTSALDILSGELIKDEQGRSRVCMQPRRGAGKLVSGTAADFLRTCCEGALVEAGVKLEQIDFFIFPTPTAWFASFGVRVLGIAPERTLNLYPHCANVGPVTSLVNLYYAAQLGKIRENDLVLMYGFGAAGAAAANVMRWGKVGLGSNPLPTVGQGGFKVR